MPKLGNKLKPSPIITVTEASPVVFNATQGTHFRLTLTANRTIAEPLNSADGQRIVLEVIGGGSGGPWTLTLTTGVDASFAYGDGFSSIPPIVVGKRYYIGLQFTQANIRWHVLSVAGGFST